MGMKLWAGPDILGKTEELVIGIVGSGALEAPLVTKAIELIARYPRMPEKIVARIEQEDRGETEVVFHFRVVYPGMDRWELFHTMELRKAIAMAPAQLDELVRVKLAARVAELNLAALVS